MLKHFNILFLFLFFVSSCAAQEATQPIEALNPKFTKTIERWLSHSVPVISVEELSNSKENYLLLDCREKEEYEVSHLPTAQYLGYKKFDIAQMKEIPKDAAIVVYCSIGYRSEKIGEQLNELGYSNVKNLYGSIFEWVNQGNEVVAPSGEITKQVHSFNKSWGKWVDETKAEKVW